MHILQEFGIVSLTMTKTYLWDYTMNSSSHKSWHRETGGGPGAKTLNPSIHLTLFEGPLVRVGSSYAATFSHVATTACVGVNFASGNPRCTSWVSRWMNEWWKWSKKINKMECTMDWTNGWTEKRKEFISVVNCFSERIHLNMSFSEFLLQSCIKLLVPENTKFLAIYASNFSKQFTYSFSHLHEMWYTHCSYDCEHIWNWFSLAMHARKAAILNYEIQISDGITPTANMTLDCKGIVDSSNECVVGQGGNMNAMKTMDIQ